MRRHAILAVGLALAFGIAATIHAQPDPAKRPLCPVDDAGPKAFAELVPVLRDPRCSNCHGAIDPFKPDGGHGGGFIDPMKELEQYRDPARIESALRTSFSGTDDDGLEKAKKAVAETLQESTPTIGRGLLEKRLKSAADLVRVLPCQECHHQGNNTSWRLATNTFPDKSDEGLCEHFQKTLGTAENFIDHIARDSLGFIPIAFQGTRGLNAQGQDVSEQRTGNPFTPVPVAASDFATFERRARDWVKELGGKFHKPPSCGCKPHKYRLVATHKAVVNESFTDGYVRALVADKPLVFDLVVQDGQFYADTVVPRLMTVAVGGPGAACELTSTWTETWEVEGKIDDEPPGKAQFSVKQTRDAMGGMMICQTPQGPMTFPAPPGRPGPLDWIPSFAMPALLDAPKELELQIPGLSAGSKVRMEFVFEDASRQP